MNVNGQAEGIKNRTNGQRKKERTKERNKYCINKQKKKSNQNDKKQMKKWLNGKEQKSEKMIKQGEIHTVEQDRIEQRRQEKKKTERKKKLKWKGEILSLFRSVWVSTSFVLFSFSSLSSHSLIFLFHLQIFTIASFYLLSFLSLPIYSFPFILSSSQFLRFPPVPFYFFHFF